MSRDRRALDAKAGRRAPGHLLRALALLMALSNAGMVRAGETLQLAQAAPPAPCQPNLGPYGWDVPTVTCMCRAAPPRDARVFGTDAYSSLSSICGAAHHAGAVPRGGGPVTLSRADPRWSYVGTTRNGVTSRPQVHGDKSFYFPATTPPPPPDSPAWTGRATRLKGDWSHDCVYGDVIPAGTFVLDIARDGSITGTFALRGEGTRSVTGRVLADAAASGESTGSELRWSGAIWNNLQGDKTAGRGTLEWPGHARPCNGGWWSDPYP